MARACYIPQCTESSTMGERLPLTFKDWDEYHLFQRHVWVCLTEEGVTDAVILMIGAPTAGWETDPRKPYQAWTPSTPAEFYIFSGHTLVQAMQADLAIDPANVWAGKHLTFLTETSAQGTGFSDTPVGRKLRALGLLWQKKLEGHPPFIFRLCAKTEPPTEGLFKNAIVVYHPSMFPPVAP